MTESFKHVLHRVATQINQKLDALLTIASFSDQKCQPPSALIAAMRYAALSGGKRVRGFLAMEVTCLFQDKYKRASLENNALAIAVALEMIHCYSLIHDDLPAMDDALMRRGQASLHKMFDEATAILAGDAFLGYAFEVLLSPEAHPEPQRRLEVAREIARAIGPCGMLGGQTLDLRAEHKQCSIAEINTIHHMKTGCLFIASCRCGALCANADPEDIARITRFAAAFGAAFQLTDDLLDVKGNIQETGKLPGGDLQKGKATLVALKGIDYVKRKRDAYVKTAQEQLAPYGQAGQRLHDAAEFMLLRTG